MLNYAFHPLAATDVDEAVGYFESLESGKGLELAGCVQETIERLCDFPESGPVTRGSLRSMLIQPATRWHFTLHYRITSDAILVVAFAHQRRQPFYWLARQ